MPEYMTNEELDRMAEEIYEAIMVPKEESKNAKVQDLQKGRYNR